MANSLNLNSAFYFIFRNLSLIAYIIGIQKSKFANIKFCEFDQSEPVAKLNSVYIVGPFQMAPN